MSVGPASPPRATRPGRAPSAVAAAGLARSRGVTRLRREVTRRATAKLRAANAGGGSDARGGSDQTRRSQQRAVANPGDVLSELRGRSSFLAAAEEEARTHAPALAALRSELEALDPTRPPGACAEALRELRDRAERTLEALTDEPRVLRRVEFPTNRLEALRAAVANRERLERLRAKAEATFKGAGSSSKGAGEGAREEPKQKHPVVTLASLRDAFATLESLRVAADEILAARASDEKRFLAAGVGFDWDEPKRAREAAVAMAARALRLALDAAKTARGGDGGGGPEGGPPREDDGAAKTFLRDDKENAAPTLPTTTATTTTKARRWVPRAPAPPGTKELAALRRACDLAYRAYAGCGGADVEMDAAAEEAADEVARFGDDAWNAADAMLSVGAD